MSKSKTNQHFLFSTDESRRDFLLKTTALGVIGFSGNILSALGKSSHGPKSNFVEQGNYLIKNAYLITVDDDLGEIPDGDIHIQDGVIKAIGNNLNISGAKEISGKDMIVLPGLIDTHWHMWTALLKSMAAIRPGKGYFDTTSIFGPKFSPEDMYLGTRLATTEAVFSGITTVHDWSHNVRSLEHAEASLRALQESGLRARYSCGTASGQDGSEPMDFSILNQLHANWTNRSNDDLIHLGFAWRGLGGHPGIDSEAEVGMSELRKARAMNLPITVHASAGSVMEKLTTAGVMGPDMQLVHGMDATETQIKHMVDAGASISISPYSELRIGYGFPPIDKLLDAKATIGLSIDTTTLSGNADMFAVMKVFLNLANAMNEKEFSLTSKRVLELATIEGAKSLGISQQTGSLTVGKKADIIMVNTKVPNIGLVTSPVDQLVEAAQPSNVDLVMVGGKILKQHGKLVGVDEEQLYEDSKKALEKLKESVGEAVG